MAQGQFYSGNSIKDLAAMVSAMKLRWTALVHHAGNGSRLRDSHCLVRIWSDGIRAVVVLTELETNQGTSVTNAYEEIAGQMRNVVLQFIMSDSWPVRVTWIEQYQYKSQPELVTLRWSENGKVCLSPPMWKPLPQSLVTQLGLAWDDLCHIPEV